MTNRNRLLLLIASLSSCCTYGQSITGDDACPCLSEYELRDEDHSEASLANFYNTVGRSADPLSYGFGCQPHDVNSLECSDTNGCASMVPLPPDCDKSYCQRSFCWVDPNNCARKSNPSTLFPGRYYSYATCGELDSFTYTERLKSLKGKTFQVGYVHNTGGWKGAYNPSGSFAMNEQWTGPSVDFFREAALEGGFQINMTQPPDFLKNHSRAFFGSSNFDLCVYATSLGYLDFCVGGFFINEKRSSVTTMYETSNDPIYLFTFDESDSGATSWEAFIATTLTIFTPFTAGAWMMIFLFALPVLGLLLFFHEYGSPGSAFPTREPILVEREDSLGNRSTEVINRQIPLYKHIGNSVYMGTLSFFSGSYDQSVVTISGKISLLAIASFILLIISVYTANLASILTQEAQASSIDSIDMAVKQGLNICAERKIANLLMDSFGIDGKHIVKDPTSLGGDGRPGFNCPKCRSRERVFDMMRPSHTDSSLHCNVAVASLEDLDILHRYGTHCDKVKVGDSIAYRTFGIPISDDKSDALVSLFHKLKSNGVMTKKLLAAAPQSTCPEKGGEGSALNVKQLTGVWVITFGFALFALLVKFAARKSTGAKLLSRDEPGAFRNERALRRVDQWMNGPPADVVIKDRQGTRWRYDAEGNELQEVSVGTIAEMQPLHKQIGSNNSVSGMLTRDGAHDLQLVVEVEEEEETVEDCKNNTCNSSRGGDQSIGDASQWSGTFRRWTGRSK